MRVCARCGKNRNEKFFVGTRGKICDRCRRQARSKAAHEARVKSKYGLEAGDYELLYQAQGGACAICLERRAGRLSVDHRHSDGVCRGLLCKRCNSSLLARGARDNSEILRRAAEYLDDPPAVRIIGEKRAA